MEPERDTIIKVGDKEYELILTTAAVKSLAKKFGGMKNLEKKFSDDAVFAFDEMSEVVCLLANQSVSIRNLSNQDNPEPLLTPEQFELLTGPADFPLFSAALTAAMEKGMSRNVESEPEGKNE